MEKLPAYRTAFDAAVFIRDFMKKENFFDKVLDERLCVLMRNVSLAQFDLFDHVAED